MVADFIHSLDRDRLDLKHERSKRMTLISDNNLARLTFAALAMLALAATAAHAQGDSAVAGSVTINSAFPGGNVKVTHNEGDSVHVEPDLRGDSPWFYWYFEATAVKPGRVSFVFPEKVAGFKNGAIGYQGPAISTDQGKTWKWMGIDNVQGNAWGWGQLLTLDRCSGTSGADKRDRSNF